MHTKKQLKAIRTVGRKEDGNTTIAQVELDALCTTAEIGIDAANILRWWRKLHKDGYSTLRPLEVQEIDNLLARAFPKKKCATCGGSGRLPVPGNPAGVTPNPRCYACSGSGEVEVKE